MGSIFVSGVLKQTLSDSNGNVRKQKHCYSFTKPKLSYNARLCCSCLQRNTRSLRFIGELKVSNVCGLLRVEFQGATITCM